MMIPYAAPDATGETCLYRHFDRRSNLLYVGVSLNALKRLMQHREVSGWFGEIHRVEIERFATRQEALSAERNAISGENPRHNIKRPKPKIPTRVEVIVKAEAQKILFRLTELAPVYNLAGAGRVLGVGPTRIKQMIAAGEIGSVALPPHRQGAKPRQGVTGWQILEYLEAMSNG